MDSESCIKNKDEERSQTKNLNIVSDDGDFSEPSRFRYRSIDIDSLNRFLVRCEFGYVFPCGIFLWIIFLFLGQ